MRRHLSSSLSRSGTVLAWVLALGTGAPALAQDAAPTPPPEASAEAAADSGSSIKLGAMLDVGAPDGVGVSLVLRPAPWLRINGGVTTNTLSLGLRGGISLVPLSTFVSPSINLDLGHYFDANYNTLVDRFGGIPLKTNTPIDDVGYNYGGASVGLEIGKPERFSFSLKAGLAHGSLVIQDAERLLQDVTGDPDITAKPLTFRFTTPSIKLGFLLYFF